MEPAAFGTMCRRMIRHVEAPIACSASMNSRSRSDMNVPLMSRARVRPEQQGEQQPDEQLTVRLLAELAGQHEQDRDQRDDQHEVGEPHQRLVDDAAVVAG